MSYSAVASEDGSYSCVAPMNLVSTSMEPRSLTRVELSLLFIMVLKRSGTGPWNSINAVPLVPISDEERVISFTSNLNADVQTSPVFIETISFIILDIESWTFKVT